MSPSLPDLLPMAALWLVFLLLGGTVLAALVFAVRNLSYGRVQRVSAAVFGGSLLLFGLLGLVGGSWIRAGIVTLLALLLVLMLVLVASGVRHLTDR
jgi:hypothetical protein